MERTVKYDKRVCANVGGLMLPQPFIEINHRIIYLQDRQHFNGLRVSFDKQKNRFFCMINSKPVILNGYVP